MSWDERFSQEYDSWSAGITADIGFYTGLALEADGPLVELAVGNGRVAIPVARATERCVIGIDTSPVMLGQARERASEAGVELDLRLGLLDVAGLVVDALYGDFDLTPLHANSGEYVFVARHP